MEEKHVESFWEKVNRDGACWVWTGATNKKGYGVAWDGKRTQKAHRLAYMLTYGAMPDMCVLHRCDNPSCVNPDHLFTGTRADNNRDMVNKGRHVSGGTYIDSSSAKYKRGVNHHASKLTPRIVKDIRSDYASGNYSYSKLSKKYGLSLGHLNRIVKRKAWSHVE